MVEVKREVNNIFATTHLESILQLLFRTVKFKLFCLNKEDKTSPNSNVIR